MPLILAGKDLESAVPELGRYPTLRFTYRAAPTEQVYEVLAASGKARFDAVSKLLAGQLTSWDAQHDGQALKLTVATLRRLPYRVLETLFAIVAGMTAE